MIVEAIGDQHIDHMMRLLKLRQMPPRALFETPRTGFIAIDEDVPIAMGFLRLVEGNFALFDSFISNPEIIGSLRHVALDGITAALIRMAKVKKLKNIIAYTVDVGTIERAKRHGFTAMSHTVIGIDFKGVEE